MKIPEKSQQALKNIANLTSCEQRTTKQKYNKNKTFALLKFSIAADLFILLRSNKSCKLILIQTYGLNKMNEHSKMVKSVKLR